MRKVRLYPGSRTLVAIPAVLKILNRNDIVLPPYIESYDVVETAHLEVVADPLGAVNYRGFVFIDERTDFRLEQGNVLER